MHQTEATLYFTYLAGLTLLALISFAFLVEIYRHHKFKAIVQKKIALRDIQIIEDERRRIAKDLHDDFGSMVASIRIRAENLSTIYPDHKQLIQIITHTHKMLEKLKMISRNLVPKILEYEGLAPAINELLFDIKDIGIIKVDAIIEEITVPLDSQKSLIVYRLIQEILTNTLKHAKANRINFMLRVTYCELILDIKDNGIGFIKEKTRKQNQHFGLANIQSRLSLLNAKWYCKTKPNEGTNYHIQIPIESLTYGNK